MRKASTLLGWLGAVGLGFALVSFLLQLFSGVILLGGFDFWFMVVNAVVGVALLVLSVGANLEGLRERARSGGARRAGRAGSNAVAQAVLLVAILGGLAFLSTRYHHRWDWTEAGSHSLSSQTLNVLAGLEQDVHVAAIFQSALAAEPRAFLERYTLEAPERFEVEFVDPNSQPGRLEALGVDGAAVGTGLLHVTIGAESVDVDELSEEALTNALVKLTRLESKRVAFLDGHNERVIEGDGADEVDGFAAAAEALRNENYQVETLLLAATGSVPEGVDVVIAAGPTRPYHEVEHEALRRYVAGGGALLVLVDPRARTDLYDDLAAWGVEVGDDVIVDQVQGLIGRPTTPFAAEYADHPITRELGDITLFHTARSVQPAAGSPLEVLVRTGEASWAERDMERLTTTGEAEPDPESDLVGRVPVVIGGELAGEAPGRLVVVGDSDFATNQLIREFRNRDLFVNAVNWLLGDVEAISIRPAPARTSRLQLSQDQYETVRILALFAVPEAIALVGVLVWWRRRAS